ncbi:MAG TPA: hypothetical protein VJL81_18035 [Solirubrobacterales bacterium]|nr:hypothetical protein [Solirubrobacterales bacterium]
MLTQATRPGPTEDLLLRDDIVSYFPAPATTPGANSTNIADLRSGMRCFHKPIGGVDVRLAGLYGHVPTSVGLNECAAWRLARFLGSPYDELVPTTILRFHSGKAGIGTLYVAADGWGSLADEQVGEAVNPEPVTIPACCDPAAFFDALIAQQDRHWGQYRWDAGSRRLGLIDHGFAFARGQDRLNASVFLERRHAEGRGALDSDETAALESLQAKEFLGLGRILDPAQAAALQNRVALMLSKGELIQPGEWG